ncbi:ABC transporter ATP-binding protein [Paenibacillus ehimensis]|uniref:ABC transporter ATP-binding protein n=1 Tax=Paenibacillus ehimensis TaxID=79264 RepID=A0ABT8VDM5_9BACL|nr:ABC transporter ATP-binding protein [Paenibacillus ehimensis]MDO3679060.1 ABC transporter ATP-binding protein [Paenibacillus ehimensis]
MLHAKNLSKSYPLPGKRQVNVLNIAHFAMQAGERVALVGPSGSGKSTLLQLIAGILRPTSGTIRLLDRQLERLSEAELDRFRAQHIGFVFQSFNLLPGFTALENVLAAMQFGKTVPPKAQKQRASELLAQVGLEHRLHHKPGQLSGGEQQRVSIARALANRPALVLADEPTASLDHANAEQVFSLLAEACEQNGTALLLCTHDPELAGRLDRVVSLRELSIFDTREVG